MNLKNKGLWNQVRTLLACPAALAPGSSGKRANSSRALSFEPLEDRIVLSAASPADFIAQPDGALDGKIVFTSGGHGLEWIGSGFTLNRSEFGSTEVNEALGNQDQLFFFADHLLRAGATVVPMRPIGHRLNEVVLDNDSPEVTYSGSWSNSTSSVYYDEDYGAVADSVSYRFAAIDATETATATYTPDIPESGFYPVYTWVLDSSNRTNQLYRINDSAGGVTEIRVDHRMVGKGWVYLGTYHFDAGTSGSVVISNQSTDGGSNVIADAIRFGNGMGDQLDGPNGIGHPSGSTSGAPREDEASLLWTWRAIGQGNSAASVIGTSNVSAPHRMAEHMNNNANPFGTSVYIGFHSNATASHTARGAVGLINSSFALQTPNQPELALFTGRQINQDMEAIDGLFEHDWSPRPHTFSSTFGEIDLGQNAEMDATIIEVAFHDQAQDADLLNDPKVRDQLARSTYEAVIEYFSNFGGLADTTSLPSKPTGITATTNAIGDITVSWEPGPTGVQGGTPTGYRIYISRDGFGYLGYDEVAGAGSGSHTFLAAELDDDPYYFKVVAVNSGGESPRSLVAAATKSGPSDPRVLIVDGFDRNTRNQNERYSDPFSGDPDGLDLVDRVRPRYNKTFDYSIQVAEAVEAYGSNLGISTSSNEAVISGDVDLTDYESVIWILGEESTADDTFNSTEQTLVSQFLSGGGNLFVSGAEIAWDLDAQNNGQAFINNDLHADYVGDDAGTYNVAGVAGSILDGLSFSFDDGDIFYDVNFPDRIAPSSGGTTILNYVGGTGGGAGIQFDGGAGQEKVVLFGFPFETITSEQDRNNVMARVLQFFEVESNLTVIDETLNNDTGAPTYVTTGGWTTSNNPGFETTYQFTSTIGSSTATWTFDAPFAGQAEVFVSNPAGGSFATNANYQIDTGNGVQSVDVDQQDNHLQFVSIGSYAFEAGARTITLDAASSSGGSFIVADAVRVVLVGQAPLNTGDYNGNGVVDTADYTVWQDSFGQTVTPGSGADGDGDGVIGQGDYTFWKANFGTVVADATSTVSETTSADSASAQSVSAPTDPAPPVSLVQAEEARIETVLAESLEVVEAKLSASLVPPLDQTSDRQTNRLLQRTSDNSPQKSDLDLLLAVRSRAIEKVWEGPDAPLRPTTGQELDAAETLEVVFSQFGSTWHRPI